MSVSSYHLRWHSVLHVGSRGSRTWVELVDEQTREVIFSHQVQTPFKVL